MRCPPRPTLFPYTTLFRSHRSHPSPIRQRAAGCVGTGIEVGLARGTAAGVHERVAGQRDQDLVAHAIASSRLARYTLVQDRKSTRLNSSHVEISYAVFCLK